MAYTIKYLYNKFLDKIDQEGSDIISPEQMMELLETEVTGYIEEVFKYVENNQQLKDSILPLSKPFYDDAIVNPANNKEMVVALPNDYLHLETIDVTIPGHEVRKVNVKRRGAILANKNNPLDKPTDQYPTVIEYSDTIAVIGSSETVGVKVNGFYIAKPTYGEAVEPYDEVAVDLPDQTVQKMLIKMVVNYKERTGDPTFQQAYIQNQGFGNANK